MMRNDLSQMISVDVRKFTTYEEISAKNTFLDANETFVVSNALRKARNICHANWHVIQEYCYRTIDFLKVITVTYTKM